MSATLGVADLNFFDCEGQLFNVVDVGRVYQDGTAFIVELHTGKSFNKKYETVAEATAMVDAWKAALTSVSTTITAAGTVAATGSLQFLAQSNYSDNQTEVMTDANSNTLTFEYNVSGSYTPVGGRIGVDISTVSTATDVASRFLTAFGEEAALGNIHMTVSFDAVNKITFTDETLGAAGNVALTGTSPTIRTGMSGGV